MEFRLLVYYLNPSYSPGRCLHRCESASGCRSTSSGCLWNKAWKFQRSGKQTGHQRGSPAGRFMANTHCLPVAAVKASHLPQSTLACPSGKRLSQLGPLAGLPPSDAGRGLSSANSILYR